MSDELTGSQLEQIQKSLKEDFLLIRKSHIIGGITFAMVLGGVTVAGRFQPPLR